MFISFINITHYLVFKEQNLREIISQNQVNKYKVANWNLLDIIPNPEGFLRFVFY